MSDHEALRADVLVVGGRGAGCKAAMVAADVAAHGIPRPRKQQLRDEYCREEDNQEIRVRIRRGRAPGVGTEEQDGLRVECWAILRLTWSTSAMVTMSRTIRLPYTIK